MCSRPPPARQVRSAGPEAWLGRPAPHVLELDGPEDEDALGPATTLAPPSAAPGAGGAGPGAGAGGHGGDALVSWDYRQTAAVAQRRRTSFRRWAGKSEEGMQLRWQRLAYSIVCEPCWRERHAASSALSTPPPACPAASRRRWRRRATATASCCCAARTTAWGAPRLVPQPAWVSRSLLVLCTAACLSRPWRMRPCHCSRASCLMPCLTRLPTPPMPPQREHHGHQAAAGPGGGGAGGGGDRPARQLPHLPHPAVRAKGGRAGMECAACGGKRERPPAPLPARGAGRGEWLARSGSGRMPAVPPACSLPPTLLRSACPVQGRRGAAHRRPGPDRLPGGSAGGGASLGAPADPGVFSRGEVARRKGHGGRGAAPLAGEAGGHPGASPAERALGAPPPPPPRRTAGCGAAATTPSTPAARVGWGAGPGAVQGAAHRLKTWSTQLRRRWQCRPAVTSAPLLPRSPLCPRSRAHLPGLRHLRKEGGPQGLRLQRAPPGALLTGQVRGAGGARHGGVRPPAAQVGAALCCGGSQWLGFREVLWRHSVLH